MKVIWTNTASRNYRKNLDYLKNNWSKKVTDNFISKVDESISLIILNNNIGHYEKKLGFHKLLIVKQIYLFYEIIGKKIYIHNIWNNKQKPYWN